MSAGFSFNFGHDDIEMGSDAEEEPANEATNQEKIHESAQSQVHYLQDMLSKLPSQISYNTVALSSEDGSTITVQRREVFDIRAQIMAEDTSLNEETLAGLSNDDITPNVYEGGFKTWECSVDLANYLLRQFELHRLQGINNIVELGAGSALPSLIFLRHLLLWHGKRPQHARHLSLTVSDFNPSVLSLSTVPNLLLNWCSHHELLPSQPNGDLEITSDLCRQFLADLESRKFGINVVSGSWGPGMVHILPDFVEPVRGTPTTLVLASETIYSPRTLTLFIETLLGILQAAKDANETAIGLVAAKRVYFGVGGGVDEFLRISKEKGGEAKLVWESEGSGVGRVILEVWLSSQIVERARST